jgi:hypothetical protein
MALRLDQRAEQRGIQMIVLDDEDAFLHRFPSLDIEKSWGTHRHA